MYFKCLTSLLPSVILSYAKNNSTYCFYFYFYFMYTKKTRIFHQRSKKLHLDLNLSLFPLVRLNTILVTNRWNGSHLSWIFSKFLTVTLRTFVLTQMRRLSFPNVDPSVFWSTEMTANPNQHWERKITQVFQDLWGGLQLSSAIKLCVLNASVYKGHSFRIGAARAADVRRTD